MATADLIIDECLKAIGEADVDNPVEMSRAEVLTHINQLYQYDIGPLVKNVASFVWDSSDAAHTITAGVGSLPSDYLSTIQVYDGDAVDNNPLHLIGTIEDKVDDDADTTQYMIVNPSTLWLFGKTPSNIIKMYYYQTPTALTDVDTSIPIALKAKFHYDIFIARIKELYAIRQNNTYDQLDQRALIVDLLKQIEYEHGAGYGDHSIRVIVDIYGGC